MAKNESVKKLKLLVTIIPHGKKEVYIELIEYFEVNFQMYHLGRGTATDELSSLLGLEDNSKDVIFSVIREDKVHDCLLMLEDRFDQTKSRGVAFAVPFESIIGTQNYLFYSNLGGLQHV